LTLLARLPETPARLQQELGLQSTLGLALTATSGMAAPEVEQTYARLRLLAEALAVIDHTGERWWEAEVYRLQGELLLQQAVADQPRAEACFRHALDVAQCQQAKSLELRAAASLSRLWQRQGKREAAHDLLAPVYGWFTEGFDTADIQEARALLEDLST
jgi:predicted ATPase